MITNASDNVNPCGDHHNVAGITIREYFAAKAMQGYMANKFAPHQDAYSIAEYSVRCADALITALNEATDQL